MSSSGEGVGNVDGPSESNFEDNKPLWSHVTKIGKTSEGGGNVAFKCNYCNATYKGSCYRVKAHLLKITGHGIKVCPKISLSQVAELQRKINEAEQKSRKELPKEIPLPSSHASSKEWLQEDPQRVSPQKDLEISNMRKTCLKRYFPNEEERRSVNIELAKFFGYLEDFGDQESLRDRWRIDPKMWWLIHGASAPLLQTIAIKLLGQVSSSSCCERNWSTYSFIQSMKRNKITPQRAEDLVYVHTNLRLLSRKTPTYMEVDNRMWDVAGDGFESLEDMGILEIANLSLDKPELEAMLFIEDDIEVQRQTTEEANLVIPNIE